MIEQNTGREKLIKLLFHYLQYTLPVLHTNTQTPIVYAKLTLSKLIELLKNLFFLIYNMSNCPTDDC